jgi:preprotein translocase subunit SecA
MNRQRDVIYRMRDAILREPDLRPVYDEMVAGLASALVRRTAGGAKYAEEWDWEGLRGELQATFLADLQLPEGDRREQDRDGLRQLLTDLASRRYDERHEELGDELFLDLSRYVFLRTIDAKWRDHLYALDMVREGISLRAYGQKDPLVEYKQESFRLFDDMLGDLYKESLTLLFRAQVQTPDDRRRPAPRQTVHAYKPEANRAGAAPDGEPKPAAQARRAADKVGRNDPCPCGSGKKFNRCCGRGN